MSDTPPNMVLYDSSFRRVMDALLPYVEGLEAMLLQSSLVTGYGLKPEVSAALDGEMSAMLRRHVSLTVLRSGGIFFTPDNLADDLVSRVMDDLPPHMAFDPACGSGNLLLALAKRLPVAKSPVDTLVEWGNRLRGMDTQEILVRAARARLALLACVRTGKCLSARNISELPDLLPHLHVGDSLSAEWPHGTAYVMNPPFNVLKLRRRQVLWASGSVSAAALFVDRALTFAQPGDHIVALLPDVLRSGTRYEKWRRSIDQKAQAVTISVKGLFGNTADVDVFVLEAIASHSRTGDQGSTNWHGLEDTSESPTPRVGDMFTVRVGPVVPHRDKLEGPVHPYLDVHDARPWETMRVESQHRAFSGTVFKPPFVAIRRTSRPGSAHRAVATLVVGDDSIAVENHLIVALPKNGGERACLELLRVLCQENTTDWLDDRIRCRHLTTKAVADIPWQRIVETML